MKLSDQIIEHGPYQAGQRMTWLLAAVVDLTQINELRDELIAARKAGEERQRFGVTGAASCEDAQTWLTCDRCAWLAVYDEPITLAELNQRADEHAEVCR